MSVYFAGNVLLPFAGNVMLSWIDFCLFRWQRTASHRWQRTAVIVQFFAECHICLFSTGYKHATAENDKKYKVEIRHNLVLYSRAFGTF
jgi:hypothetical protein